MVYADIARGKALTYVLGQAKVTDSAGKSLDFSEPKAEPDAEAAAEEKKPAAKKAPAKKPAAKKD